MPFSYSVAYSSQAFARRHIGSDDKEISSMLADLGCNSLDQLMERALPQDIVNKNLNLLHGLSEAQALNKIAAISAQNQKLYSMIGMGYVNSVMPQVIKRNLMTNPGWYTAYTPYQAEIAQGRLELLLNFQQMITDLTGMDIANASLLDEATAAAEAMSMALRLVTKSSQTIFVDANCYPQTIAVIKTRARAINVKVVEGNPLDLNAEHIDHYFAVLVQYPDNLGAVHDFRHLADLCHSTGSVLVMITDLMSLLLLESPGALGADIALGSAQGFGIPMGYGGPHAAFFACKDIYKRFMPGRIVGVSKDKHGRTALRLVLQTREQHIRREKATSNICTSQVLLAMINACYGMYHGPEGLHSIAVRIHEFTKKFYIEINSLGWSVVNQSFYNTLTINTGQDTSLILARALHKGINLRRVDALHLALTFDECSEPEHIRLLLGCFDVKKEEINEEAYYIEEMDYLEEIEYERKASAAAIENLQHSNSASLQIHGIPEQLKRTTPYLQHPVFNSYHSETEMMRYLHKLEKKDIALNHSMIPLGSCTMKLNAAAEMEPISWPTFADIHPFCPPNQAKGYKILIDSLADMLCEITGFSAVSMQPNSGAQGEYAGLMAIKAYLANQNQHQRNICFIPGSAHGTNPASAAMAGFKVIFIGCTSNGQIDLLDLQAKAKEHSKTLAALMLTYPSTYGIYDQDVRRICQIIHEHGGQVYMDGANLNALVGFVKPAEIGVDVMHINLHKTFCIPHGGGGPGMGPIAVAAHLRMFLPEHPMINAGVTKSFGSVSAAPWGSANILIISWMYIIMMGEAGLKKATAVAVLHANYIAYRLKPYYPILYSGQNNLVAHECIIDLRPIKQATGISEEDLAKRLIDYGFHAPTMSFPVPGTLMIEPTESESLAEIEHFISAMIAIKAEIEAVKQGQYTLEDNPLVNAPHLAEDIVVDCWEHPYSRQQAVYPLPFVKENKYWCPVSRIDNAYGDRNLFCSCIPATD